MLVIIYNQEQTQNNKYIQSYKLNKFCREETKDAMRPVIRGSNLDWEVKES